MDRISNVKSSVRRFLLGAFALGWALNAPGLHAMLKDVGFADVRTITPQPSAIFRAARAVSHAVRGRNTLTEAYRQDRAVVHAMK